MNSAFHIGQIMPMAESVEPQSVSARPHWPELDIRKGYKGNTQRARECLQVRGAVELQER